MRFDRFESPLQNPSDSHHNQRPRDVVHMPVQHNELSGGNELQAGTMAGHTCYIKAPTMTSFSTL